MRQENNYSALYLTTFFVLSWIATYAQQTDFTFNQIGKPEGLHAENITYGLKDSRGFLWLCSNKGLTRYDGKDFKNFRYSLADPQSISNDILLHIHEDRQGFLWISTNQGINKFDPLTENFQRFQHDPYDSTSICSNEVIKSLEDSTGNIWIATSNGLSVYNPIKKKFRSWTHFAIPDNTNQISNLPVSDIHQDIHDKNKLWVTCPNGLFSFDKETELFSAYPAEDRNKLNTAAQKESRAFFVRIYQDKDGTLWLGNYYGELYHFNPITQSWRIFSLFPEKTTYTAIQSIFNYDSLTFWITSAHILGVKVFNKKTYETNSINHDPNNPASVPRNLHHIFRDNEGIIWLTADRHIIKIDPYLQFFKYQSVSKDYYGEWTSAITESDTLLFTGIGKMVCLYTKDSKKTICTNIPEKYLLQKQVNINKLVYDSKTQTLWVATTNGLLLFDPARQTFSSAEEKLGFKDKLLQKSVKAIHCDKDGNFWIACYYNRLYKYIPNAHQWINLSEEIHSIRHSQKGLKLYDIAEDNNGIIWIATHAGLRLIDKSTNKLVHIADYIENSKRIVSLKIMCVGRNASGAMWIGALGNGIVEIVPEKKKFKISRGFSTQEGLADNNLTDLDFDQTGNLWAITHDGLSQINLLTNSVKNYAEKDGLWTGSRSLFVSSTGILYVGATSGFHFFNPKEFKKKEIIPPVYVQRTDGQKIIRGLENKHPVMPYTDNNLTFSFNVLNFSKPESNQYKYQLSGFQNTWVNASSSKNTVSYTNLDPGEYTFTVKAANNDGVWNEVGASMNITILPPPWKTWWAYTLYSLSFCTLVFFARKEIINRERLRTKAKLKELETIKLQEVDQLKSHFFANISHEFRTPLTLLLGPIENRMAKTTDATDKAELSIMKRNASRLLVLVNQLLDLSRLEARTLKLTCNYSSITAFIQSISSQFSSMASSKKIQFSLVAEPDIMLYFDSDKIEKIITNLLANAFKFTDEHGTIELRITPREATKEFKNGFVEITVQDTGTGIEPQHISKIFDRFYQADASATRLYEGSGIGLSLTKELVELHYGNIRVTSETGKGSCFIIELPIGNAHLKPSEIAEPHLLSETIAFPVNSDNATSYPKKDLSDSRVRVLIVEDNSDLRSYLTSILNETYSIVEAVDGEEGETLAVETIPDLIISDLMMPKKDGLELCKSLKVNEKTSHIPVILLTARADLESRLEGLQTGADDYIAKPFDARELHVRIHNLIEIRKKIQVKFSNKLNLVGSEIKADSIEDRFLKNVKATIENHINDTTFSVEQLADEVAMSSIQVYRKLKALSGYTPNELIRNIRLEHAAALLAQRAGNVSEIAYQCGFNNLSYFAKCFKEKFGVSPSEY